ncbi:DUF2892 domain-containing protein [Candidatus Nitronereus thalassa]|uniref:DUF2892 domain-containing protein n=1 Tax=Candidatus Nitronereus thalassa TaxID=3020898 RepID=A0ABU3K8S7_9BACT|nr:DUF2892 domain-containing protein [Candidatus Nitronereus thalassa]MDT7042796.1 DUF2892 domain-containing protein [Candidatus Nitronereus thalassa]
MITKNVGKKEGIFRIVLGLGLLALPPMFQFPVWATTVTYGFGLVALITGIIGYCPGWHLFGINTCHKDDSNQSTN